MVKVLRARLVGMILLVIAMSALAADLPPAVKADRALVKAEREIREGEFPTALATLDKIVALSQSHEDVELPADFWFHHATAAYQSGLFARAIKSAEQYLILVGQGGQHYAPALELIDKAEVGRDEANRRGTKLRQVAEEIAAIERAANFEFRSGLVAEKYGEELFDGDSIGGEERTYRMSINLGDDCRLRISRSVRIHTESNGRFGADDWWFSDSFETELDAKLTEHDPIEASSYSVTRKFDTSESRTIHTKKPREGVRLKFDSAIVERTHHSDGSSVPSGGVSMESMESDISLPLNREIPWVAALGRAAGSGSVEVAVLAFSGDCADPVPRHQDFTTDVDGWPTSSPACSPAAARRWPTRCCSPTASWTATPAWSCCWRTARTTAATSARRWRPCRPAGPSSATRRWASASRRTRRPPTTCARSPPGRAAPTTTRRTPPSSPTCSWRSWTRSASSTCSGSSGATRRHHPARMPRKRTPRSRTRTTA